MSKSRNAEMDFANITDCIDIINRYRLLTLDAWSALTESAIPAADWLLVTVCLIVSLKLCIETLARNSYQCQFEYFIDINPMFQHVDLLIRIRQARARAHTNNPTEYLNLKLPCLRT